MEIAGPVKDERCKFLTEFAVKFFDYPRRRGET